MSDIPYRTSLRVLGRLLNSDKARMATICEIDDGFLLYYCAQGDPCRVTSRAIHSGEVLDLDDLFQGQRGKPELGGSLKGLQSVLGFRQSEALKFQKSHPLCPMGYENFLRALGDALDRRNAQAVLIQELDDNAHVEYTIDRADFVMRDGQRLAMPGRREEHYTADAIDALARKCREQTAEKVRRNGQNLSYNPLDIATYLDTAHTLEDDGHPREAEDLYRKAAQLAPAHPEAHYGLARLAQRRGDRKAAIKELQQAMALDPGNARLPHLLGRLHVERGRYDDAIDPFKRAVALEPGNRLYLFDLNRAYEQLGGPPETEETQAPLTLYSLDGLDAGAQSSASPDALAPFWSGDDVPAPPAPPIAAEPAILPFRRDGAPVAERAPADEREGERALPAGDRDLSFSLMRQGSARPAPKELPPSAERSHAGASLRARLSSGAPGVPDGEAMEPAPAGDDAQAAQAAQAATLPAMARPAAETPPALPATAIAPFTAEAPSWDAALNGPSGHAPPAAGGKPQEPVTPAAGALPTLGIDLSGEWAASASALPAVHIPADGAMAGAALPLAVPTEGEGRRAKGESDRARPVENGDSQRAGYASPDVSTEAVHLAAAVMRAEDLVRAEPHRAELHRKLGFLLAKQGRSEEAAAEFRRAAECGRRRLTES